MMKSVAPPPPFSLSQTIEKKKKKTKFTKIFQKIFSYLEDRRRNPKRVPSSPGWIERSRKRPPFVGSFRRFFLSSFSNTRRLFFFPFLVDATDPAPLLFISPIQIILFFFFLLRLDYPTVK